MTKNGIINGPHPPITVLNGKSHKNHSLRFHHNETLSSQIRHGGIDLNEIECIDSSTHRHHRRYTDIESYEQQNRNEIRLTTQRLTNEIEKSINASFDNRLSLSASALSTTIRKDQTANSHYDDNNDDNFASRHCFVKRYHRLNDSNTKTIYSTCQSSTHIDGSSSPNFVESTDGTGNSCESNCDLRRIQWPVNDTEMKLNSPNDGDDDDNVDEHHNCGVINEHNNNNGDNSKNCHREQTQMYSCNYIVCGWLILAIICNQSCGLLQTIVDTWKHKLYKFLLANGSFMRTATLLATKIKTTTKAAMTAVTAREVAVVAAASTTTASGTKSHTTPVPSSSSSSDNIIQNMACLPFIAVIWLLYCVLWLLSVTCAAMLRPIPQKVSQRMNLAVQHQQGINAISQNSNNKPM